MNASQPVERVVALLCEADYERLPQPVVVADIPFDFSAVLVKSSSLDLVVVIDTVTDLDIASIRRRVEGLSRALDRVGSRRPVTVVFVGPEPPSELQLALMHVARVLFAGVPKGTRELKEAIAILLPLHRVALADMPESWPSARQKLLTAHPDAATLLKASKRGSAAVAQAVRREMLKPIKSDGESQ